jgi:phosphoglycerate dehydrogenase-like enzyme
VELSVLVPADHREHARAAMPAHRVLTYDPAEPFGADGAEAEVMVPPFLSDARLMARLGELPKLRLVQLLTVGAEVWLGRLPAGVALSTARGAHSASTAEWVLTVMLAGYRELPRFLAAAAERRWAYGDTDGLFGKRVLVVGAGDVGRHIERRLTACEAGVTMVGRRGGDGTYAVTDLPDLLPSHDAVVLVVPLTEETKGMVDKDFLAAMPDGALLVNAARGPVVHTDALLAELRSGRLRAALDVTDPEPLPADHPLWTVPGLIVTPHVAGSVRGFFHRAYRVAAAQIETFAEGHDPANLITGNY